MFFYNKIWLGIFEIQILKKISTLRVFLRILNLREKQIIIEFARKTNNKELEINIIRQYNNCSRARKLKGDIKIQDIFNDNRDAYLAANGQRDIRETVLKNVSLMRQCKSLELGMNWFECPNCGKFYVCMHTCKSMFCPTCGAKRRDKISANVAFRYTT